MLEQRDGEATKPSVTLYRADPAPHRGHVRPTWRRVVPGQEHENDQLLIVVKRGTGVDYEQRLTPVQWGPGDMPFKHDAYVHRGEYDWHLLDRAVP
ncbi:hypothetical protein O1611_g3841 [Lasiodiplodia mahajangana]|uniref:Uncharacterized protein n=1 Tax=Lasiodiplodia mahajangana TaxID=1108764 RepID=A0ACC2JR99_9PEZI|nr:hypothetical protein O1611_g3841 [Lasiodiplodia mahajangana]